MKSWVLAAAAGLVLLTPIATQAQPAFDAAVKRTTVELAAAQLRNRYVFPDVGAKAAEKIEAQLAAGAYDSAATSPAFAQRLTADIAEVAHDKHIRVSARGPGPAGPPPAPAAGAPPPQAPAPPPEGGVTRADRLAGDIGYIDIIGFPPPAAFKPAIDRAMASVADTKALIFDVRRNGGGSAESVAYLESFFQSDDKPAHLLDFINRVPNTDTFRTQVVMSIPTPTKYLGKPVYILTSPATFSGGEGLSYNMQAMKVAKTVGETTGGGANPGGTVPLGAQFGMFVPNGRPQSPVTHTNWEGVGVIPDIASPAADALKVALTTLGQAPTATGITELSLARLYTPTTLPPARDTPAAGTEAALRQIVTDLAQGTPHYETMTAGMAEVTKTQLPQLSAAVGGMGAMKSIAFKGGDVQGRDTYEVTFEKGVLRFVLGLDSAGKVATVNFRQMA